MANKDGFLNFDQIITGIEAREFGIDGAEDIFDEIDLDGGSFVKKGRSPSGYGRRESSTEHFSDWDFNANDQDR